MTETFKDPDFVPLGVALENARRKLAADPDNPDAKSWLAALERFDSMKEILQPPK